MLFCRNSRDDAVRKARLRKNCPAAENHKSQRQPGGVMDFSAQKEYAKHVAHLYLNGIKWIIFGILSGILVGFVAAEFANGVTFVTELRREHPLLLCLLPPVRRRHRQGGI